jgi:lipoprotein-releasing system ATP-binding protein
VRSLEIVRAVPEDGAMSDLAVRHLVKCYPTADGELPILRGVDLELSRGEALAIVGPSGAGKSTLLYIVGVLDTPTSGEVRLLDASPHQSSPLQQAAFRNQKVGFVFQDHHLLPQCTVLENVLLPAIPLGITAETEARARSLLERVGLSARLTHRPAQLSGGERQRVAVCRALINEPVLLLADEPTGNLDRATAESVGGLLLDLNREQRTILICVTHSTELASRFPRRSELRDGELHDVS